MVLVYYSRHPIKKQGCPAYYPAKYKNGCLFILDWHPFVFLLLSRDEIMRLQLCNMRWGIETSFRELKYSWVTTLPKLVMHILRKSPSETAACFGGAPFGLFSMILTLGIPDCFSLFYLVSSASSASSAAMASLPSSTLRL